MKTDFNFSGYANGSGAAAVNIPDGTDFNSFPESSDTTQNRGMFRIRTAIQVLNEAASQPDPKELYPNLIIENEFIICFADTGIGKTVFAVQMGIHIAKTQIVLYIDLELSDKQFEKRYRNSAGKHFRFPDNFYRLDFTPRFEMPANLTYDEYFIQSLTDALNSTGAKVVIIDNMTKLAAGDTDTAKATIPVMEALTRLKFDYGITFLVLEHNKKVDSSRPISLNDLQGSKMKSNFADAVFSIGRSASDKYLRYIKQLKVRSAECVFDTENVMMCELVQDEGFLQLRHIGYGSEYSYLKQPDETERSDRKATATEMRAQGLSNVEIAKKLGVTEGAVRKWFKS